MYRLKLRVFPQNSKVPGVSRVEWSGEFPKHHYDYGREIVCSTFEELHERVILFIARFGFTEDELAERMDDLKCKQCNSDYPEYAISFYEITPDVDEMVEGFWSHSSSYCLGEMFPRHISEILEIFETCEKKNDRNADECYEYMDNYRVAVKGIEEAEKCYQKTAEKGCCGFYDKEHVIDGTTYLIGFNYGH